MSIPDIIALTSAIIALLAALFAFLAWRSTYQALIHQVLEDTQSDYRSPEMLFALTRLKDFYTEHGKDKFVEEYLKVRDEEHKWVMSQEKHTMIDFEKSTLHYQRRLVDHFFWHLSTLYVNGALPKRVIYGYWEEAVLRIIPDILVPISNKLRQVDYDPPLAPLSDKDTLIILYKDSKGSSRISKNQ